MVSRVESNLPLGIRYMAEHLWDTQSFSNLENNSFSQRTQCRLLSLRQAEKGEKVPANQSQLQWGESPPAELCAWVPNHSPSLLPAQLSIHHLRLLPHCRREQRHTRWMENFSLHRQHTSLHAVAGARHNNPVQQIIQHWAPGVMGLENSQLSTIKWGSHLDLRSLWGLWFPLLSLEVLNWDMLGTASLFPEIFPRSRQ